MKFDIKPKQIVYAVKIVEAILKLLSKSNETYSSLVELLMEKYDKDLTENSDLFFEKDSDMTVLNMLEKFINRSCRCSDEKNLRDWKLKFSKYMAYCIVRINGRGF